MLYRFKSKASADVIMLSAHGQQVLALWHKDPNGPGILLPEDIPAAIGALQQAVLADEALPPPDGVVPPSTDDTVPVSGVPLRSRFEPLVRLLQHAAREGVEVVWGG